MKFVAFERAAQGTGASRRLRITGRTPGIVYGGTSEPLAIELDHNALWHAIKKEAFHASILDMELGGVESKVLLRNVQMHPFKHMKVPLHFSGEENSPAFKIDACLITHVVTDLEVACLPADLPEFIAVDLSDLKKGTSLHAKDLTLPNGVKAVIRGRENPVIVSVVTPVAEVVEAPVAAPVKGKGKK